MVARDQSNIPIVRAIGRIADIPEKRVVALIIGAGHTEKIVSLLAQEGRPHAVISTNSHADKTYNEADHLVRYQRKMQLLPADNDGVSETLLKSYPRLIKPKTVLNEDWFRADAELRHALRAAAAHYLGKMQPGLPPATATEAMTPPPTIPPNKTFTAQGEPEPRGRGQSASRFVYEGVRVYLDGEHNFSRDGKSVTVKVFLNRAEKAKESVVYARLSVAPVVEVESLDHERKLMEALSSVRKPRPPVVKPLEGKSEGKKVRTVILDQQTRAQISTDAGALAEAVQ